jgi:hypothetical protein
MEPVQGLHKATLMRLSSHPHAPHKPGTSAFHKGAIQGAYRGYTGGKAPAWEVIANGKPPQSLLLARQFAAVEPGGACSGGQMGYGLAIFV